MQNARPSASFTGPTATAQSQLTSWYIYTYNPLFVNIALYSAGTPQKPHRTTSLPPRPSLATGTLPSNKH